MIQYMWQRTSECTLTTLYMHVGLCVFIGMCVLNYVISVCVCVHVLCNQKIIVTISAISVINYMYMYMCIYMPLSKFHFPWQYKVKYFPCTCTLYIHVHVYTMYIHTLYVHVHVQYVWFHTRIYGGILRCLLWTPNRRLKGTWM